MDDRPDQLRGRDTPSEGARDKLSSERGEVNPNPAATDDELEELRLELSRTRAEMSETVHALQERLNPQYVREQASSQAKDTGETGRFQRNRDDKRQPCSGGFGRGGAPRSRMADRQRPR